MDIQRHNNTESTNTTTDKQYFLFEEDSWAYCPYQRFFAKSINEPLPQHWESALLNKNNNFKHEYINFHEHKQDNNKAHDSNATVKNLVSSSMSSSPMSSLNSFNSTFSRMHTTESHSNTMDTEEEEIDSFDLPKPIHVKVEPTFIKSNKFNKSNISNQFSKPLYMGSFISNRNICYDDNIMVPKENLKTDNFKYVNKITKTKNKKSGLKIKTAT